MNILIIGSIKEWAFENHYIKHLKKLEISVDSFPAHDIFFSYYYKSILNKIKFRLKISSIYQRINKELLEVTKNKRYDVIWIFKGMEIYPQTLQELKDREITLVNFNPDHPFMHTYSGSGNSNVKKSIGIFDLHLCYNLAVKKRIESEFKIKCVWLPFGYEEDAITIPNKNEEIVRACFIGNPDIFRAKIIINLARKGVPIDLYGNNWKDWIKESSELKVSIHPAVYKNDFNKVATLYRLQLNIFRPHNENSHNMRTFEMPGFGCIMLAPISKEHTVLFKDKEEVYFYEDELELHSKALSILDMDYETALTIRRNAIKRSVVSKYSYRHRAIQVLEIFQELKSS
jgi:spore maturation protein CgeB